MPGLVEQQIEVLQKKKAAAELQVAEAAKVAAFQAEELRRHEAQIAHDQQVAMILQQLETSDLISLAEASVAALAGNMPSKIRESTRAAVLRREIPRGAGKAAFFHAFNASNVAPIKIETFNN